MSVAKKLIKQFSGRNAFSVVLIIIALHLIIMAVYMNGDRLERRAEKRDAVIQKIINVINLLYATPVSNRQEAVKALSDPYLDASISDKPLWALKFTEASYWKISQALRRQLGLFSISLQLQPGQWLNIHATIYSHFLLTQLIFFGIEFFIFSIILGSLWFVGRFTKPFKSFIEMAERLGLDPNSKLLPIDGPLVVKEASAAMNRMQHRIQELIRDRTQILAAISHDLRTPITRLRLRVQFIEDEDLSNSLLADLSEMETMIKETMAFAKDDQINEEKTQIDLVSLVGAVCEAFADQGHKVVAKIPDHRIGFSGRPVAMRRALDNLVGNAVRYGKNVEVIIYSRDGIIYILVKDDGPGIPEKDLDRVFAPFYRAESSRSRDTGGVGLGLAVCQEIIKSHFGQIYLHNRTQGGLCAVIELPVE